jgi:serine O-acetyltransferase
MEWLRFCTGPRQAAGATLLMPRTSIATDDTGPGLVELVREDWRAYGGDWTQPGFRALLLHRIDNWRRRRHVAIRMITAPPMRFLRVYIRNHYGIELPQQAIIGRRMLIGHQGAIVVHPNARIGDDCVIRQGCTIGAVELRNIDVAPVLGDGVRMGAGAVIIGGVRVGDNARIGPNAVVTKNVAANSVVMAPPPREFKDAVTPDPE